ncbi:MAG: hypothetical protein R8J94_00095 [Acidimicrobiia bacterium]|nr:hypothetical protein [Acidimicrobiia bacterium]
MSDEHPPTDEELPLAYRKGSSTEGILPILGYVLGDQLGSRLFGDTAGDRIAIILMTVAAGWAVVQRQRRGESIGWWIPSVAVYLFFRGVAGLIWGEDVFLAIGIGLKVALGLGALVSVFIGRPAAAQLAPLVLPFSAEVREHKRYHTTMRNLTLAYAVYQLITVGFEIWLLGETDSGTGFLIIRTLIGSAAGFVGFIAAVFYVDRRLRAIPGFSGVMEMFEEIGVALEERRDAAKDS